MKINNNSSYIFLLIKVPISLILIILFFEFIAFCLSDYRAIRHGLDRKVSNLENNISIYNSNTLLFGDSVTKDIADDFYISADCCNLLNFTTNRASGFLGSYLLYKKYRENNKAPEYIIISSTPNFLNFFPEDETKKLYLTSVFDTKEENKIISSYYKISANKKLNYSPLSWVKQKYGFTIFNLENKVVYPLVNAFGFINTRTALSFGKKTIPDIEIINDLREKVVINNNQELNNENSNLIITPQVNKLMEDFFTLLQNDGTSVFIAWAPLRKSYYDIIKNNNELVQLEKYLQIKSKKNNVNLYLHDFSAEGVFSDIAFRDQDHLKEGYWKIYYAYLLNKFINSIYSKAN